MDFYGENWTVFFVQLEFQGKLINEQYSRSRITVFFAIFNWYSSFDQEELDDEMVKKIVQKVVAANSDGVTKEKCKNWIDYFC